MGRQHGRCPVTGRPGVELLGASENQSPHALVRPGETQGTETEPDRPASQALREHKRLRQHPRNIGFGWLALDRFTADGARRAASAPGHKEAMPTTTIRPSAGSGILIHNFLPHSLQRSARSLTFPSRRTATSRATGPWPSQRTLSAIAWIACATETRCEAARQEGEESKGGDSKTALSGQHPPRGRRRVLQSEHGSRLPRSGSGPRARRVHPDRARRFAAVQRGTHRLHLHRRAGDRRPAAGDP